MTNRIDMIKVVNEWADRDDFYERAKSMGTLAAKAFFLEEQQHKASGERLKNDLQKHRAQMTGLENIAETTLKFSDVLDYIKKQTARQAGWKKEVNGERFGVKLKNYLEGDFRNNDVDRVCGELSIDNQTDGDKRLRQQVTLELVRQFIRQLVVQYEYAVSEVESTRT